VHKHIGTGRLSFAPADQMQAVLGVMPGSVTAFALINDLNKQVRFIADKALLSFETVYFHPLINTATTGLHRDEFRRFIAATGHELTEIDFSAL